jgi:6-phosphogluconolactonase (cycloisomerase 2 family)
MSAGICLFATQVLAFDPLFNTRVDYWVGEGSPAFVCAADFDGDGKADLAAANADIPPSGPQSCNVSVLKNNGDGTFAAPVIYYVGEGYLTSLCAADFDGDGKLDLAVVNSDIMYGNSGCVSVMKNNGDGTFAAAVSYLLGGGFLGSVCAADFDGDGRSDLAVVNADSSSVLILKNNGDGTFAAAIDYAAGGLSVCAADFDGDRKPDLAVADGNVSILKNNGDGTFAAAVTYGAGDGAQFVCAADFNGDGKPDLAAANYGSKDVSVLKNNGDGTFAAAIDYALGNWPVSVCATDFDGDGKPELAVALVDPFDSGSESYDVSVMKNNGDGTFAAAIDYDVGSWPNSVCAADFNGDGKLDLAVANSKAENISILKNKGDGTFIAAIECTVGSDPESVCAADFDGDGKPDLAVADYNSNDVSVLRNNGDGSFTAAVNYGVGDGSMSVCAADFDGDGKPDLAVANYSSNGVSILKNNGDGIFSAAVNYGVGNGPVSVCATDFDGDGDNDLAVANYDSDSVSVLKNIGDGTFAAAVNYGVGDGPWSVCADDFDGDGKPDLAVGYYVFSNVSILKNNGDGTFAAAVDYGLGGYHSMSVCAADFDGDGRPDLALAWDDVLILKNNGDGTFAAPVNYAVAFVPFIVCAADFDGDGHPDLAAVNWWVYDDGVSVLKNNGDGTFAAPVVHGYGVGRGATALCSADFDGDGGNDLAVTNSLNSVSILINTRSHVATLLQSYHAALTGNSVSVSWALSEVDEDARFSILRAQEPSWRFEELTDAPIERDRLSFAFIDAACLPGSSYKYRVDVEAQGNPRRTLFETDVIVTPSLPATLYQNFPNPFNPSTEIKYYLPKKSRVVAGIYNVSGKRIAQLVREEQEKGFHVVKWNGIDDRGNAAASGVYFCRLAADKVRISKKIILLR